ATVTVLSVSRDVMLPLPVSLFFSAYRPPRSLHSFPTRRSSDLGAAGIAAAALGTESFERVDKIVGPGNQYVTAAKAQLVGTVGTDRKSTRLNSSHDQISYAVFCLKKKNNNYHSRYPAQDTPQAS